MKILVTGRPGCGKTTLVEKVARRFAAEAGGFLTREMRDEKGVRLGFRIVTLDGRTATLAHVGFPSRVRVGRYGVDLEALENVAVAALREALRSKRLVVVDEIGKMEMASEGFRSAVLEALDSPCAVLATIHAHRHPFTDAVKARRDVRLAELTPANRDRLAEAIEGWLRRALAGPV